MPGGGRGGERPRAAHRLHDHRAPRLEAVGRPGAGRDRRSRFLIHWAISSPRRGSSADPGEEPLTRAERARLATFRIPKRRDDWLLGRSTAKAVASAALAEAFPAAWPGGAIEIANEPGGLPYARLAPETVPRAGFAPGDRLPLALSISHAGGRALCAAATLAVPGAPAALGIDLGELEPRSEALARTFFTEEEQRLVRGAAPDDRDLRANLVWCAKEAVLKALGLGLTVDTLQLTCLPADGRADPAAWPLEPAQGEWQTFTVRCGPAVLAGGSTVRGLWRTFPGFVAALARRD